MKKITFSLLGVAIGAMAFGQDANKAPSQLRSYDQETVKIQRNHAVSSTEAVIWSEDFSGGIPATWTNAGFDGNLSPLPNALWEYRGPSTTPNNTVGSRGAFANANDPILSTSAGNGFIIFDSDFLDNGGNATNPGGGVAPAPHVGTLTTDVIDLSAKQFVMLELESYARVFFANMQVALSSDGGATWPDTILVHSDATLEVNGVSPNAEALQYNVSNEIGGSANAKLRFIFDGRPGNANGNSYYFWLLDDIKISDLPVHAIRFVDNPDGAPAHDIIYGSAPGEGKYGLLTLKQARAIAFDSNILNFGSATQTNVKLDVEIYDSNDNLVQTLSSATGTATSGNIVDYNILNTAGWTPTGQDLYKFVYVGSSDSCNGVIAPMQRDTFLVSVNDSLMSLDFGFFDNRIGTDDLGADGVALASRFDIVQDERLFGAELWLSNTTVAGGIIEFTVMDTTGFDFINGFPSTPLAYYQHTVTAQDIAARKIRADFTDANGNPVYLSTQTPNGGSYYVVVTMFSNNDANPINVRNDQTFPQSARASIMFTTTGTPRWFTGFLDSDIMNAPHIRAIMCPAATAAACMTISIDEVDLNNEVKVYPNPASEYVNLDLGEIEGELKINVIDLQGRTVIQSVEQVTSGSTLPVSLETLTPGVYFMNLQHGENISTFKLTVQ